MTPRTLLLVEDTASDELLARRALRDAGVAISVARDGEEAVARLLGGGALPGLVLLDLQLPKLDGVEVVTRLRADPRTRALPVVVFTASAAPGDVRAAYRAGANSVVRKPMEPGELQQKLGSIVRYWFEICEPSVGKED